VHVYVFCERRVGTAHKKDIYVRKLTIGIHTSTCHLHYITIIQLWFKTMKTLSSDTHPEAERFHIELIRKANISQRLQMVASLVKTTRQLSWQGICERYPNEREDARIQRFIHLLYGNESLAKQVKDLVVLRKARASLTIKEEG
jgi:hypothetical protein